MSPTPGQAATARRGSGWWRSCSVPGCPPQVGACSSVENRLTIISTLGDFFLTEMPRRLTRSGRIGSASDSRFCTSTCEMFRSVPGLKVTVSV